MFCVQSCVFHKHLSSTHCKSELIDSAWVVIVPGQKCIKNDLSFKLEDLLKKLFKRLVSCISVMGVGHSSVREEVFS